MLEPPISSPLRRVRRTVVEVGAAISQVQAHIEKSEPDARDQYRGHGHNVSNAPEGNRQRMTARSFLQTDFRPAAMQWDLHSSIA